MRQKTNDAPMVWAVLLTTLLTPLTAYSVDLLAIYHQAEREDAQLQQIQASHAATLETREQSHAQAFLPSAKLSASVFGNVQDIQLQGVAVGLGGRDRFLSGDYTLILSQPLYHRDRLIALDQADRRVEQADVELAAAQQDLMMRVAERYFAVLAAADNLNLALAQKAALSRQFHEARQRYAAGEIAITDVPEAEAGKDLAVADEIEARHQLDDAREALREITGEDYEHLATLIADIPLAQPEPADEKRWVGQAMAQNLKITVAELSAELAREEMERQSSGHWPSLDLVGSNGFASTGGRLGASDIHASAVGLSLNVPLYEGGQVDSRTREAARRHEESLAALKQQQRAVHREARDAYLGVISGISRIHALQQAARSHQAAVAAVKAGIEVGSRTALDGVLAEREGYRVKRDLSRARYNYLLDTLRLKRAVGLLAEKDLNRLNGWLGDAATR